MKGTFLSRNGIRSVFMIKNQFSNLQENVKHGDFMMPFAQYVSWIPKSFTTFEMHWHKEVEVIYVQSGCCEMNIDLERYVVKEGDILIVRPYALHSFKQYDDENGCIFMWVFDINMLTYGITDACYVKYFRPFLEGKYEYPAVIEEGLQGYEEIKEVLNNIHEVCDAKDEMIELNLKWHLEKLFYLLFKHIFKKKIIQEEHKQEAVQNIKKALDYIQEHNQSTLTIAELANLLHFSEPYFMRFFKKHTGITCVDYINDFRMNKATELLATTDLSIMEIAMQVGLHNISYFNRLFKKKFETTPKEYRKMYRK